MLNKEHREKTTTEQRGERRSEEREKGKKGKEEKKALKRRVRWRGEERRNRKGEYCDSEGQRKAVKVAKQAAETKT